MKRILTALAAVFCMSVAGVAAGGERVQHCHYGGGTKVAFSCKAYDKYYERQNAVSQWEMPIGASIARDFREELGEPVVEEADVPSGSCRYGQQRSICDKVAAQQFQDAWMWEHAQKFLEGYDPVDPEMLPLDS